MSNLTRSELDRLLPLCKMAAIEAAEAILGIYCSEIAVEHKEDASPVTLADHAAEMLSILSGKVHRVDEVAIQEWRGDKIFRERFFYDPGPPKS